MTNSDVATTCLQHVAAPTECTPDARNRVRARTSYPSQVAASSHPLGAMEVEAPPESHTEPVDDAGPPFVWVLGFMNAMEGVGDDAGSPFVWVLSFWAALWGQLLGIVRWLRLAVRLCFCSSMCVHVYRLMTNSDVATTCLQHVAAPTECTPDARNRVRARTSYPSQVAASSHPLGAMEVEAPPESHTEPVDDAGPPFVWVLGFMNAMEGVGDDAGSPFVWVLSFWAALWGQLLGIVRWLRLAVRLCFCSSMCVHVYRLMTNSDVATTCLQHVAAPTECTPDARNRVRARTSYPSQVAASSHPLGAMEVEAPPESHTEPVDDAGPTFVWSWFGLH